jgi:hypothetical protein
MMYVSANEKAVSLNVQRYTPGDAVFLDDTRVWHDAVGLCTLESS